MSFGDELAKQCPCGDAIQTGQVAYSLVGEIFLLGRVQDNSLDAPFWTYRA